jgi:ABC-type multidrug transport system fused ATPase/permease subunit
MIVLVLIMIGAYMGARMSLYALLFILFMLFIISIIQKKFKDAAKISGFTICGIILIFIIDTQSNCGVVARVTQQIHNYTHVLETITESKESIQNQEEDNNIAETTKENTSDITNQVSKPRHTEVMDAGGSRVELWKIAFDKISKKPWLGYGYAAEAKMINGQIAETSLTHFHNQFLSWLIWGGILGFISGVAMLISPLFIFRSKLSGLVFATGWILVCMTESFFWLPMNLAWYILALYIYEKHYDKNAI